MQSGVLAPNRMYSEVSIHLAVLTIVDKFGAMVLLSRPDVSESEIAAGSLSRRYAASITGNTGGTWCLCR